MQPLRGLLVLFAAARAELRVPSAPTDALLEIVGGDSVEVAWAPPLSDGGAALKPARARAAMPKRGLWAQASAPAPKSAAFRVDDARAARDGAWRSQTTASWQPRRSRAPDETSTWAAAGRDPDLPIRSRGLALRQS